jgi:hypothetical protein
VYEKKIFIFFLSENYLYFILRKCCSQYMLNDKKVLFNSRTILTDIFFYSNNAIILRDICFGENNIMKRV